MSRFDGKSDNSFMKIPFTKMQGAGNDFVVIDETRVQYGLKAPHYRFLADRHYGVGADQILTVRAAPSPGVDFEYVIHNADGGEVEHCGNGARCFVRFVHEQGLSKKNPIRVKVHGGEIELRAQSDGRVRVDMGPPVFEYVRIPFDPSQAVEVDQVHSNSITNAFASWGLNGIQEQIQRLGLRANNAVADDVRYSVSVLSMGNPHAVILVDDVEGAPVDTLGPWVEHHPAFPKRVNVGFMQIVSRGSVKLRVFERGAGETLACGTGACAAVVAGIQKGLLDSCVNVQTRGGELTIEWSNAFDSKSVAPVLMTGPAVSVFKGEIEINE